MNRIAEEVPDPNMLVFVDLRRRGMNVRYRGDVGAQARAFAALFRGDLSKEQATQSFRPSPSMGIIAYDHCGGPC